MNSDNKKIPDPLLERLDLGLKRLDRAYEDITPPSLSALTLQITAESVRLRNRARKELLLFWLLSLGLVGVFLALLNEAPFIYLVIQGAIPAAALIIAAASRIPRKGYGAEE
ncbi:DUF5345 family protein [Paenibacillus sp. BR2-3]|uniref:DUF5345 family protein n=1 Tax=Paenibacillus sp. BR2-3 TaxID=3048494 RepID=UPI0039774856